MSLASRVRGLLSENDMSHRLQELKPPRRVDWDALYREGTPSWETGEPTAELIRLVREKAIARAEPSNWAAARGPTPSISPRPASRMTAVDSSPTALERAGRAEREDALLRLVFADAFEFGQTAGQFDLVFDVGLYHFIRQTDLERFLDLLWRTTRPGSHYWTIVARKTNSLAGNPPPVAQKHIYRELGRLFEVVEVRECRLEGVSVKEGYPAWSCLMRRPVVGKA